MLSVADIRRWNADTVREVFHAATVRAKVTHAVSHALRDLAVFDTWGGQTTEAALHANAQIRQDLDAHGAEAVAVARAAGRAADGIDAVQRKLDELQREATSVRMTIDPVADRVVPAATFRGLELEAWLTQRRLQPRLDTVLAEANTVNGELAHAINMADGDAVIPPGPHDNRPSVQHALTEDLPQDPQRFHDLWDQLTEAEKDWLYDQDPAIGNRAGMAFVDRDRYNRRHLGELTLTAQAERDRLAAEHPRWVDDPAPSTVDGSLPSGWIPWKQKWDSLTHDLQGYRAVQEGLQARDGVQRLLGLIDGAGHAAICIGNPDRAKRNAVFVPGTGHDPSRWRYSDDKSRAMWRAARQADPRLAATDITVTTWMGYDRPMTLWEAAWPDRARAGGAALADFTSGMRASHLGPRATDTVIGHSYGSVVVGGAASGGHHLAVDNVAVVGSPGMLVDRAAQLQLDPGANVYAMKARNDLIRWGAGGLGLGTYAPDSPAFGATMLAADPGPAWGRVFPTVDAHSSYWAPGNVALANLGAVIAGVPPARLGHR